MNYDLPKHAAAKVKRCLDDVVQLTDDPAEMLRIYLMAATMPLGSAGGALAALLERSGHPITHEVAMAQVMELVGILVTQGAEAAWQSLRSASLQHTTSGE